MSEEQRNALLAKVRERWKVGICPVCQTAAGWAVSDRTFTLIEFNKGGMILGGPVFPVLPINCTNCGYTVLLSALVAGFVSREGGGPASG